MQERVYSRDRVAEHEVELAEHQQCTYTRCKNTSIAEVQAALQELAHPPAPSTCLPTRPHFSTFAYLPACTHACACTRVHARMYTQPAMQAQESSALEAEELDAVIKNIIISVIISVIISIISVAINI